MTGLHKPNKQKLNEYFVKHTENRSKDFKKEFIGFLKDWYDNHAEPEYTDNPYTLGQEEELISDALEEFIMQNQDAQWRHDMGI